MEMPKELREDVRKCKQCRKDKAGCAPRQRTLPQRCDRCKKYNYSCSENLTAHQEKFSTHQLIRPLHVKGPGRLQSDAACLQELGDLTSLLDVIKITKSLQILHRWPYSAREAVKLRSRLENVVHESISRAQQHELEGSWREAEYLWRAIGMYAMSDRPRNIRNTRMEAKLHGPKFSNRMIGLVNLVVLHERIGDYPQAEHEQEMLIARAPSLTDANGNMAPPELWIQTLIRFYGKFQDRVAGLEIDGLKRSTLKELASLSLLFRVTALECPELYVALLNSYASMFIVPGNGPNLLHLSASRGSLTFITLLLGVGSEVDFLDDSGRTALHLAAREGHLDVAKKLLECRADANWSDDDGYTPLHFACTSGNVEVARVMLEFGADTGIRTFEEGLSPLHLATRSGDEEVVNLLLKSGTNPQEQTRNGKTALHIAAENGNKALARLFLNRGVGPDVADNYGIRPLHDAATVEIAQLLLENGADADSPDKLSETPLLSAAWREDPEVVKFLLSRAGTVNINARDDLDRTSLHRAIYIGQHEIAVDLLNAGVDVNAQDFEMRTPLHYAASSGEIQIVKELVERGANTLLLDCVGKTALDCARTAQIGAASEALRQSLETVSEVLVAAVT